MSALYLGFSTARRWSVLDEATFERSKTLPGVWSFKTVSFAYKEGDALHVAVYGYDKDQIDEISRQAQRFARNEALVQRDAHGVLRVDEQVVAARLAAQVQPVERPAPMVGEAIDGMVKPLLMLPERVERPERSRIVDSRIDLADGVSLTIDELIGRSVGVLGITGSGKSNTFAVIVEEIAPFMPFVVIDTAGEYHGLRERIPVVIFGRTAGPTVDMAVTPGQGGAVAEFSVRERVPVILDLSEFDDDPDNDERMLLVETFLKRLWSLTGRAENQKPYMVGIEEAHNYVPQAGVTPVRSLIRRIATEGRKRGLSLLLASQRSAAVEKGVLTQCHMLVLHHVMHDVDLQRYVDAVPSALMAKADVREAAFNLAQGEALVLRSKTVQRVCIRRRHTRHGGHTPGLGDTLPTVAAAAPQLDPAMLAQLRETFGEGVADTGDRDEVEALRARIRELESEIAARDARIALLLADPAPAPTVKDDLSVDEMVARRAEEAAAVERRRQERAAEVLVSRVRSGLAGYQRDFVRLLAVSGKLYQADAVRKLSIKQTTFRAPLRMLEAGLITKTGHGAGACYEWRAVDKLAAQYPALDAGQIVDRILR